MDIISIQFNYKCNITGTSVPYIIGDHPSLGNNDVDKAIRLELHHGPYNYHANVKFFNVTNKPITYCYIFKTQVGSVIKDIITERKLHSISMNCSVYDIYGIVTPVTQLILRFRVRCYVGYGNELFMYGNLEELGSWKENKSIPLFYEGKEEFWSTTITIPCSNKKRYIKYKYITVSNGHVCNIEQGEEHCIELDACQSPGILEINDTYRWEDTILSTFGRDAFVKCLNKREDPLSAPELTTDKTIPGTIKLHFHVYSPHVYHDQSLVIVGNIGELGNWDPFSGFYLCDGNFPHWHGELVVTQSKFPIEYKFVLINRKGAIFWENTESNRFIDKITCFTSDPDFPITLYRNDWFISPNPELFKGAGLYVPLFSLRTNRSQGIGSYTDLKKLVDLCTVVDCSLIQMLPINDSRNFGNWGGSFLYSQDSCFALNPIYIDLYDTTYHIPAYLLSEIEETAKHLDSLEKIDYLAVFNFKMDILKKLYDIFGRDFAISRDSYEFIEKNGQWLKPYALFCYFRDKFNTADFRKWPEYSTVTYDDITRLSNELRESLMFVYWVQYIADRQYSSTFEYATLKRVVIKCNLPIGVSINSVECWAFPELFRLNYSAGTPPDSNSPIGQNWGYPTYDWEAMEMDDYSWWKSYLSRLSELYHAIRIDHILGFFRTWEIPRESCVTGSLGIYNPANPLTVDELLERSLRDIDRYVKPYIREHLLEEKFDKCIDYVRKFFVSRDIDEFDEWYDFHEDFNTEVKISEFLENDDTLTDEDKDYYRTGLFQLLSNVILIEDPERPDCYHIKGNFKIDHVERTPEGDIDYVSSSWNELSDYERWRFEELYNDYFEYRQNDTWVSNALNKFRFLNKNTNILICAEDLGIYPHCINHCIYQSGYLSLRVQRLSKDAFSSFDDHNNFPYLGVACPSTHETSSLRGWWIENRQAVTEFWYNVLHRHETCPTVLSPLHQESIIRQNLLSNCMWAIFLLQDITSIEESLRLQTPEEESIVNTSVQSTGWTYRYPYTIEQLTSRRDFVCKVKNLINTSGRAR